MSGAYTRDFNALANFDFATKSFKKTEHDGCRPTFYMEKVLNPVTNELEEVEMVKVQQPNELLAVWGGKVTSVHRERWPQFYEAFKRREVAPENGTPLARWPEAGSNLAQLEMFKNFGLWTVEDMANMTDVACQKFHGGMTWRKRAQNYLASLKSDDGKDAQIAELRTMILALQDQMKAKGPTSPAPADGTGRDTPLVNAADQPAKAKRGRKPKVEQIAA